MLHESMFNKSKYKRGTLALYSLVYEQHVLTGCYAILKLKETGWLHLLGIVDLLYLDFLNSPP